MTREHKLALLIGFALVLVVGVVVSDHFSGANRSRLADVIPDPQSEGSPFIAGANLPLSAPLPPDAPVEDPGDQRLARSDRVQSPFSEGLDVLTTEMGKAPPVVGLVRMPTPNDPSATGASEQPSRPGDDQPAGNDSAQREIVQSSGESVPNSRTGIEKSLAERDIAYPAHIIRDGDTLWSIAADHYGDGRLHARLEEFNRARKRLGNDARLFVGATLFIPPLDVLTGKRSVTTSREASDPVAPRPQREALRPGQPPEGRPTQPTKADPNGTTKKPADARSGKAAPRTYTVQKGDTLPDIAKKTLGAQKRWREIVALNDLDDPDVIHVGAVLKIPAK